MRWNSSKPILPRLGDTRFPWESKELMLNSAEPEIVEVVCNGGLNPYRIDQLKREKNELTNSPELDLSLGFLKYWSEQQGFIPYVVYVPSRNQVTTKYLEHDLATCRSCDKSWDFTQPEYHSGRRVLSQSCSKLDLKFLDLTDSIALEEQKGRNLYWNHDEHMKASGYKFVAEQIHRNWPMLCR